MRQIARVNHIFMLFFYASYRHRIVQMVGRYDIIDVCGACVRTSVYQLNLRIFIARRQHKQLRNVREENDRKKQSEKLNEKRKMTIEKKKESFIE